MVRQVTIAANITPSMKEAIKDFVNRDMHLSPSDFVRDAIREKIRRDAPHLYAELFQQKEDTS